MSYIKKDVNFGLLFIIVLLAVIITYLGVYYNQNYTTLSADYDDKVTNLKTVTEQLLFHKSKLNETAIDLKIKEEDESELNKRYNEIRDENEGLNTDLKDKTSKLLETTSELDVSKKELEIKEKTLQSTTVELRQCEAKKRSLSSKLDSVCGGDLIYCD